MSSVELNDLILSSITDYAVVTLDADGKITSWNEGAQAILGWSRDEAVGRSADLFFTDDDVRRGRSDTEMRLAREHGSTEDERWHVRKGGERFWANGLMMPLRPENVGDATLDALEGGQDFEVAGFVKIFRDQTVARRTLAFNDGLEGRARLAMRASGGIGVWDHDMLDDVVVADEGSARLHNIEPEEARVGTSSQAFYGAIHSEDVERVMDTIAALDPGNREFASEHRVITSNGRPRWVQARGWLHLDGDERPARLSGILLDVTEGKEREARQTARLAFAEAVRDLDDPDEVSRLAVRTIGETLDVGRVGHGTLDAVARDLTLQQGWTAPGYPSFPGTFRYDEYGTFGDDLREGRTVVITDTLDDPRVTDPDSLTRLGVHALLSVPLTMRGRLRAVMFAHASQPREWSSSEVAFVQAIFDRLYAALDRIRSDRERETMNAELAHRIKNMLAIAQIVCVRSLRDARDLEEGARAVGERLGALARAQDILTSSDQTGADILEVVRDALAPHGGRTGRIHADGPALRLDAQRVLGLTLVLHELATNAAKHGALSNEAGRVEVEWTHEGDDFRFRWCEVDGPPVEPPAHRGFGSTILERLAGEYFDGDAELDLASAGLVYTIEGHVE